MYRWVRQRHMMGLRGRNFLEAPWAGGVVLLVCVIAAMLLANLPATKLYYHHLLETDLSLMVHSPDGVIDWIFPRGMTVEKFINDGLMVIFFFAVGLEIKREIVCGQLSSARRAILPVLAAAGGMLVPAIFFTAFNHGTMAANGWGSPTATDIAFAIGILSMLGNRVPVSLKIFLTALAVADDLGAILVIALFYGGKVQITCLLVALVIMLGVYFMKQMGEKRMFSYLVPAFVVWGLFYYSGVHSTISGVAMALLIPMEPRYSKEYFAHKMRWLNALMLRAASHEDFPNEEQRFYLRRMHDLSSNSVGMSYRLEHGLAPYVTFLIMPVFALANAGVEITSLEYLNIFHYSPEIGSIGMGVFFGLVLGKPLGIFLASWGAVRTGLAELPEGATWRMLLVHDVAVRRFAGLHRPRSGRPRQDRDPDGFAGRRRRGVPADLDLFGEKPPDPAGRAVGIRRAGGVCRKWRPVRTRAAGTDLFASAGALHYLCKKDSIMMKKTFPILPALVLLLAGACSKNSGGGGVKLRNDTDSVAYVIGMNVGANLLKMDSTINVNAVCEGIRDMFRGNPRLSAADAETFYLSYVNYALPEKARAYEEQFLLDIAKSNRSYARTSSGVTYTVTDVGDQNQVPTSERDSVALRWVIRTAAGDEITSSYERGDTVRSLVRNLRRGVQESVKLIGKGGKINAWMPSSAAYGAEGDKELGVAPNATLYFEIELVDLDKYTTRSRRR